MIDVRSPSNRDVVGQHSCDGCKGKKKAPLAAIATIESDPSDVGVHFMLCQECGRDLANAIGFMCIRDGGWSKLEPRKRKAQP